jgi:hypothetical protein
VLIRGCALMWILAVLKDSHSLEEKELSFGKLVAAARNRCERECQRKCGALSKSLTNRGADQPTVARHGE